jgi:hypothetical protein
MASRVRLRRRSFPAIGALWAVIASLVLLVPGAAGAATVVNGGFESGDLTGWSQSNNPSEDAGRWFAYTGTESPLNPGTVQAPPEGSFAAISDQLGPGVHVLYQDIVVEPANTQQLTMLLYYNSVPLETPEPDTLSIGVSNQQYRVDLVRPSAPIESVDPADVLAPIFGTKTGDPEDQAPFRRTIDLALFGGQTVRLRFAEAHNNGPMRAGVDSVAILGDPPLPPSSSPPLISPAPIATPPSNAIVVGKLVRNLKRGTAKLAVRLPGAGVLRATDARAKKPKLLKQATVEAAGPGTVKLALKPTGAGRAVLAREGKLAVRVALAFTPTGGTAGKVVVRKVLRLRRG